MSLVSSELKIFRIISEIKERFKFSNYPRYVLNIDDVFYKLVKEFKPGEFDYSKYTSFLEPLEELRSIPCSSNILKGNGVGYLSSNRISVLAFDGSMHGFGPHLYLPLTIVNVGYWYRNYGIDFGHGNEPHVLTELATPRVRRIEAKKVEYNVVERLINKLIGNLKFVFYDESFNLRYTLSWDHESKKEFIDVFEEHLNKVVSKNVIPVAIFYTTAADLVRGYNSVLGRNNLIDIEVPDKILMNRLLDVGHRSNLFRVYCKALTNTKLNFLAFYLKVGENNVLRVEFPDKYIDLVDKIHCAVLAESILGGGYPISLQRAHNWAVLTQKDRSIIEEEVARILGKPYVEMLYSAKLRSKRRPLV